MDSLQGNLPSSQFEEKNVNSSSLRSKIPLFIIFVVLGSVVVALPAYYYFEALKLKTMVQPEPQPAEKTVSRPLPTGVGPFEGTLPTLQRISECANGIFTEHPNTLRRAKDNSDPHGLVLEKVNSDRPILKIENIYDGSIVDADLSGLVLFHFREIIDRERYPQGYGNSFYRKTIEVGDPYTLEQLYTSISVGSHIWVYDADDVGLVLWLYCDAQ